MDFEKRFEKALVALDEAGIDRARVAGHTPWAESPGDSAASTAVRPFLGGHPVLWPSSRRNLGRIHVVLDLARSGTPTCWGCFGINSFCTHVRRCDGMADPAKRQGVQFADLGATLGE